MATIFTITEIFFEIIFISSIIDYLFHYWEERKKKSIAEEFNKRDKFFDTRFNFKLRALEELLTHIRFQVIRSKINLNGLRYYKSETKLIII